MTLTIGTSGWQYDHWRGRFYPADVPVRKWLEYYAARFACVEVNNTFYRLPERKTFDAWAARTPPGFEFAVKASRYLTHIKRLRDPDGPVRLLLERAARLGEKLGPVLVQLPPGMRADAALLDAALGAFPSHVRVAVEPRDASWWTPAIRAVLERHNAALCLADRRSRVITPLWRTADWTYIRLHEGIAAPRPCYGDGALSAWVGRVRELMGGAGEGYVFFNNDSGGCAIRDAIRFATLAARAGFETSAVPERADS